MKTYIPHSTSCELQLSTRACVTHCCLLEDICTRALVHVVAGPGSGRHLMGLGGAQARSLGAICHRPNTMSLSEAGQCADFGVLSEPFMIVTIGRDQVLLHRSARALW